MLVIRGDVRYHTMAHRYGSSVVGAFGLSAHARVGVPVADRDADARAALVGSGAAATPWRDGCIRQMTNPPSRTATATRAAVSGTQRRPRRTGGPAGTGTTGGPAGRGGTGGGAAIGTTGGGIRTPGAAGSSRSVGGPSRLPSATTSSGWSRAAGASPRV